MKSLYYWCMNDLLSTWWTIRCTINDLYMMNNPMYQLGLQLFGYIPITDIQTHPSEMAIFTWKMGHVHINDMHTPPHLCQYRTLFVQVCRSNFRECVVIADDDSYQRTHKCLFITILTKETLLCLGDRYHSLKNGKEASEVTEGKSSRMRWGR